MYVYNTKRKRAILSPTRWRLNQIWLLRIGILAIISCISYTLPDNSYKQSSCKEYILRAILKSMDLSVPFPPALLWAVVNLSISPWTKRTRITRASNGATFLHVCRGYHGRGNGSFCLTVTSAVAIYIQAESSRVQLQSLKKYLCFYATLNLSWMVIGGFALKLSALNSKSLWNNANRLNAWLIWQRMGADLRLCFRLKLRKRWKSGWEPL